MSLFYLDKGGLTAFWGKIKAKFAANITQNGSAITPTTDSDGFVTYDISAMPDSISTTTALANGDGIVFADSSDSDKLKRSSISFDGSTSSKCLTQKGTWQSFASGDHSHGAITNAGGITGSATAIGADDNLVFIDTSDSKKVKKSTITFDGSTATKALTQKGTWESFSSDSISATTALANNDGIIFADSSDSDKLKRSSISFDGSTDTKALTQAGTWKTFTDNEGTVTSVTIKGTSPIVCSNSSAITGSGTRTISLDADAARTSLGTKYGILSKSQVSDEVSSSTSTFTALDNISTVDGLTTGYWLVQATVNFSANASGYRVVVLSQNTTISSANGWGTVIVGASPSDVTRIQVMALMNVSSTTTPIHVFVKQNSGSKLTCAATMRAFRLSL